MFQWEVLAGESASLAEHGKTLVWQPACVTFVRLSCFLDGFPPGQIHFDPRTQPTGLHVQQSVAWTELAHLSQNSSESYGFETAESPSAFLESCLSSQGILCFQAALRGLCCHDLLFLLHLLRPTSFSFFSCLLLSSLLPSMSCSPCFFPYLPFFLVCTAS